MNAKKTLIYSTVGSMLEWYDFSLFGALSPTLSKIFFPEKNTVIALMLSFAIFATGFIMRPLGGILFGHIGDRYGRKNAIVLSVILMTMATTGIGLLPLHQNVIVMLIILLSLRLLQGISVGGEYPGINTFGGELGVGGQFFCYQGIVGAGCGVGMLLGVVVGSTCLAWNNPYAWRIPFLLSVFLGIVGYYLRIKAIESPIFSKSKQRGDTLLFPIKTALTQYYKRILWIVAMFSGGSIAFYFVFIYYPSFVHRIYPNYSYLGMSSVSVLINTVTILLIGFFTNSRNFYTIITASFIGCAIMPIPMLLLVNYSVQYALILQVIYAILIGLSIYNTLAIAFFSFPTEVRYTCLAIILSLTAGLFGGTYPFVSTLLVKITNTTYVPGLYLSVMLVMSLIILIKSRHLVKIGE